MRHLFLTGLIFFLFAPLAALAQSAITIPEFNPICWRKDECVSRRADLAGKPLASVSEEEKKEFEKGWVSDQALCPGTEWGKCLPATLTETEIAFGGKRQFLHIGDFIQSNYVYAVGVASILAVIMIIVAGVQWVASGGNAEIITSARKRIVGAVIGLFIAYGSYFILTTVNPALVNLRLPQVYMIKPSSLTPQFCSAAPSSTTQFAFGAEAGDQKKELKPEGNLDFSWSYKNNTATFTCGRRFFMKGGGSSPCFGDVCSEGQVCVNFDEQGQTGNYQCRTGTVAGRITNSNPFGGDCLTFTEGWETPEITDEGEQELWMICKNKKYVEVDSSATTITGESIQQYFLEASRSAIQRAVEFCGGDDKVAGAVVSFEMNEGCDPLDEDHYLGAVGTAGVDLGPSENFFTSAGARTEYSKYFILLEALRRGVRMNFDAVQVTDVDEDRDYGVYTQLVK